MLTIGRAGAIIARGVAVGACPQAGESILGMERITPIGRQIVAFVIGADGGLLACQTKNQIDPGEECFYVAGDCRQMFEVNGVKFGIAICHEGWRYPETVRWAAVRPSLRCAIPWRISFLLGHLDPPDTPDLR